MNTSLLINGKDQAAAENRTYERRDPVTGEVATVAAAASADDARKAAKAAGDAYGDWSRTSPSARRALLLKAADERLGLTRALADCLDDPRAADRVSHSLHDLFRQRIYGLALGYEDLKIIEALEFCRAVAEERPYEAGFDAALANAIYAATGKRHRSLPIEI